MIELSPLVLARALEPFPHPMRTLDALHLATLDFLRQRRLEPALASYDQHGRDRPLDGNRDHGHRLR